MTTESRQLLSIEEIISQFDITSETQKGQLRALEERDAAFERSSNAEIDAIMREGELNAQVQSAVDGILIERARKNQESAAFFGTNTQAANSVVQGMAQRIIQMHQQVQQSGAAIAEKQNMPFSDDPLGWIVNQFTLPSEAAAHNSNVAMLEREIDTLSKLQGLTSQQVALNNAIDANTNAALSHLMADRHMVIAKKNLEEAKQRNMQTGLQFANVRLAVTQSQFQNTLAVQRAMIDVQQLQLAQARKGHDAEMLKLQKRNLQLLIDKKEEDQQAREEFQAQLDRATSILGMRRMTVTEYERSPQQVKLALFDVMSNPSVSEGRLGYDTVDALQTANALNAPLTPTLTEVRKYLTSITSELMSKPEFTALKPDQQRVRMEKHIDERINAERNNIKDGQSIFSAAPLASLNKIPAVANTILWKSTFAPQANNPNAITSAQSIYDAAMALVEDNKMSLDRAASEIALIYSAVVADNNTNRDFNRFAIPMQRDYRTTIDTGAGLLSGLIGGHQTIDMTNPTQVQNAMLRAMNAKKAAQSYPGIGIYN